MFSKKKNELLIYRQSEDLGHYTEWKKGTLKRLHSFGVVYITFLNEKNYSNENRLYLPRIGLAGVCDYI